MSHIEKARQVLEIEAAGIRRIAENLDPRFDRLVDCCRESLDKGKRLVISGIGKSGQIAQKMASTLASTGSCALFLHPVEAMHGDLGMLQAGDVFIAISYSGETEELLRVLPAVRRLNVIIAAITGYEHSSLGRFADFCVPCTVDQEACPFNLAPTTTTTATLALGDALAMVLMDAKGFRLQDYGELHPSGAIGRAVTLKVKDVMRTGDRCPMVGPTATVIDAVIAMCKAKGGTVLVVDEDRRLLGCYTTGDLKRGISTDEKLTHQPVGQHMIRKPTVVGTEEMAVTILDILKERSINSLPVIAPDGRVAGLVDIQDLPRFKVF